VIRICFFSRTGRLAAVLGNPATVLAKQVWRFVSLRARSLDGVPISACCCRRACITFQVSEYLLNNSRVLNTSDNPDFATTFTAGFYIDTENTLQSLCPGYCQGWQVCRFCRSKNRPLRPVFRRAFGRPRWQIGASCICPAWPVLPLRGIYCWGRSLALVATPACSENPATSLTMLANGLSDSQSGNVCNENTLRPCCGPTAIRYDCMDAGGRATQEQLPR